MVKQVLVTATDELLAKINENLESINENLVKFARFFWYDGNYDYIEMTLPAGTQKHEVNFAFTVRKMIIISNNQIRFTLNDDKNPNIKIEAIETPYEMELVPRLLINRIWVTAPDNSDLTFKIIIMG